MDFKNSKDNSLHKLKIKAKIDAFMAAGLYDAAARERGHYERRHATYLSEYEFLNTYSAYLRALESR